MTESWECPNCQTLNITSTHCYGCGAARPGWVAPPPEAIEAARISAPVVPTLSASTVESSAESLAESAAESSEAPPADDTEPHPCWCHLVKGDHDVRDHPASANASICAKRQAPDEALAALDRREVALAQLTSDWTNPSIERSYDESDGGEQDYEDDAMLLEDHGYSKSVQRHHRQIDVTYMTDAGAKGPGSWSP